MILLSIHPDFVARIRSGEKRFEFRTRAPGSLETDPLVAVYATAPTGAVVGYFRVANVLSLPPSALWERTKDAAGISRARFRAYFKGRDTAHALEIAEWRGFRNRITVGDGGFIGMGSTVTKSVEAGTTVAGNPARLFEKKK